MKGMLRDLLTERADAAGSPALDLHGLIAQGERRITRRRRVALGGAAAALALTVGASFALSQTGDHASPPVGPPTNPPSNVDITPDATDDSRPLTYGVGATIHYGDRVIEAAEDPDGLYVFDDVAQLFDLTQKTAHCSPLFRLFRLNNCQIFYVRKPIEIHGTAATTSKATTSAAR